MYYARTEFERVNVFLDTRNDNNRRLIDVTGYASIWIIYTKVQCAFDIACFNSV